MKRIASILGFILLWLTAGLAQSGPNPLASETQTVIIPAGTHVLMHLKSPLHTTSATRGSQVYLETSIPIVQADRVAVPAGTRVVGVVEDERRPGRASGRAQFRLQFTSLILPDDHVLAISGALQGLPGSTRIRKVKPDGTIEPVDQIDRDVKTMTMGILPGAILAVVGGPLGPAARIGGFGVGLGLFKVFFSRGDPIDLPPGTAMEMVLQKPLTVEAAREQTPAATQPGGSGLSGADAENATGSSAAAGPSCATESGVQPALDLEIPE
jgi:hypothetical protein